MRNIFGAAAALLALLAFPSPGRADDDAMNFTVWQSVNSVAFGEGRRDYIFADGAFAADTAKSFAQFMQANPALVGNATVVLNSAGGDLDAGLALGRLIRANKLWTEVGSLLPLNIGVSPTVQAATIPYLRRATTPPFSGYCYSSCTFAFLGGVARSIGYGSDYGVHRFKFESGSVPDEADVAQQKSGELVKYVNEMGVGPEFITFMSLKGGNDVTHLTVQQMIDLKVVTPRWTVRWRDKAAADASGFFLGGYTTDEWGDQRVAITCAPPAAPAAPAPASAPGAAKPAPVSGLFIEFDLDPGIRAKPEDIVKAVQHYAIGVDDGSLIIPAANIFKPAAAVPSTTTERPRLTVTIQVPHSIADVLEQSQHLEFAVILDPAAHLPLRVLRFETTLDVPKLKKYVATCH